MSGYLATGGRRDPFLPHLLEAIRRADRIDLAVAFIKSSGLALLFDALADALQYRAARLRILTSDYLDVTEPQALRRLMLLGERGADIRVFESGDQSFHLKAYIAIQTQDGREVWGCAFVGSSNISRTALTDGLEWNYRVDRIADSESAGDGPLHQICAEFESLIAHPRVRRLDDTWIDDYDERRSVLRHLPVFPDWDEPEAPRPTPNAVQLEALAALDATRAAGYLRGLVVMATGIGKTFLAAFDSERLSVARLLFVAHREEILLQAESSFQLVQPGRRVGRYTGERKDADVDLLFASVQTLGQSRHLDRFAPDHFDYVVVDEFHHAAAPTYRRLLGHFKPRFLLGLTATPERTDQSDILSLCDDNLVYGRNLFDGITLGLLCRFRYYGIYDETVDYQEIPWRNGRFDPESLSNKLATLGRARHALAQWQEKAQSRTLAFCVSRRHADFMAERFRKEGIRAAAVYQGSSLDRSAALEQLERGDLQVIFSVDLFNEGVDLPAIDTVMMLRPTESKVLFLQQLGRGLRRAPDKDHLVVLDFIGNHKGFLNKPQALFDVGSGYAALADFARKARNGDLPLPPGCFATYDLAIIDFLARLQGRGPTSDYQALRESLGRRPTLAEFYRSGSCIPELRRLHGQWFTLLQDQDDLDTEESRCLERQTDFLREAETTAMTRSFKAVLLESLLDHDGFRQPLSVEELAEHARTVFRRRRRFIPDLRTDLQDLDDAKAGQWLRYWRANPINAWTGGNRSGQSRAWFEVREGRFSPTFDVAGEDLDTFQSMVRELVDYRFAAYEPRLTKTTAGEEGPERAEVQSTESARVLPFSRPTASTPARVELPYYPDLRIACGHFRRGRGDSEQRCAFDDQGYGRLDPERDFVARAVGHSMDGGSRPIHDGDYLLLERIAPTQAGTLNGQIVAIERQDAGEDQYLLRRVIKTADGRYQLKANHPDYPEIEADEDMRPLARLKAVLDAVEMCNA
ncbi:MULTISPECIES: DEAD/DEAH box helicase family protein [unclassified Thiocapsa]|uniref:DEAD/DEAH box helicase family protein n=1 Tax=unclassified Thiocapsa TaxID=2641286 RepID=UPI0035AEFBA2